MTPTNQQLSDVLQTLSQHVMQMDEIILTMCEAHNCRSKFLAAMLPNLTAAQRKVLTDAASRSETSFEHLEHATRQFRKIFEQCPFWK
jgi:hypothetical protein